jgi:hypothetical protein
LPFSFFSKLFKNKIRRPGVNMRYFKVFKFAMVFIVFSSAIARAEFTAKINALNRQRFILFKETFISSNTFACYIAGGKQYVGNVRGDKFISPPILNLHKINSKHPEFTKISRKASLQILANHCKSGEVFDPRRSGNSKKPGFTTPVSSSPTATFSPRPTTSQTAVPSYTPTSPTPTFSAPTSTPTSTPNNTGTASVLVPIPLLDQWKSQMLSYGALHCNNYQNGTINFDTHLLATYYDAEWVFYQIGDYTHDQKWYACAQAAEKIYRDQYLIPNNGVVPGYWDFSHGVTRDFLSTGDTTSKNAAFMLSENASYAPDITPLSWTVDSTMSREVAYAIMAYLNAETIGHSHRSRTEDFVNQALGHLNQWTVAKTAPYVRPFMFSLTAHALISYDSQIGGNSQILPAIKTAADWIWNNTWLPDQECFQYTDRNVDSGGVEPAPDLNLLIAPVYAWLWHKTGDVTYMNMADKIFVGGVKSAYLVNGKQFNQNYRWSFDYIKWRSTPPLK